MSASLGVELVAGFVLSLLIVQAVRAMAYRLDWLDRPNERSSHHRPVPRGGGLAIVIVTVCGGTALLAIAGSLTSGWKTILASASLISIVSFIDDRRSLPSSVRLLVHLAAALATITAYGPIARIALPGVFQIATPWVTMPLTILWITGLTNIYNFMDGIDGIAAVQAIVAGASWMLIGSATNQSAIVILAGLVAASSLGFLAHNWPPAAIFMGDVGSAFLGYLFAVFAVAGSGSNDSRVPFAAALVMWPFLFDGTFTIMRRLLRGENIATAHNSHIYQRLVRAGWSHLRVTTLYGVMAAFGGLSAMAMISGAPGWKMTYVMIPLACAGLCWLVVGAERVRRVKVPPSAEEFR